PIADAAATYLPTRTISDADARALSYGQWITPTVAAPTQPVAALTPDGTLVALLENTRRGGQPYAKPVLVIAAA
ncbi:MAG: tRNA pseudouridine(55) synthase TruB, partial [Cellulomonadaceae bacterium]|nr:tRNA pseudouridine(55) synthase TruB [Cellulomonadaceae bacterium]